jgi:hypothetical protein
MAVNRFAAACATCSATVPALGGVLAKQGRRWVVRHLACADGVPGVVEFRLDGGATLIRNRRGRCEDAPCCGCCTF